MLKRRRHKRLLNSNSVITVKYKYGLRFYKKDALDVGDISGGGVKVCLEPKLKPGTIVDLDIKLKDYKEIISAQGEVAWSKEHETKLQGKPCFDTGIIFTKIDPLSICKIYTYFQERNLPIKLT